jgi:hypothetical protein
VEFENRKIRLEQSKEENRMKMDSNTIDPLTKQWWKIEGQGMWRLVVAAMVAALVVILLDPDYFHPNLCELLIAISSRLCFRIKLCC